MMNASDAVNLYIETRQLDSTKSYVIRIFNAVQFIRSFLSMVVLCERNKCIFPRVIRLLFLFLVSLFSFVFVFNLISFFTFISTLYYCSECIHLQEYMFLHWLYRLNLRSAETSEKIIWSPLLDLAYMKRKDKKNKRKWLKENSISSLIFTKYI